MLERSFLGATKHLYNWLCPLVGLLVTHSFDDPHIAPCWPTWPCFIITVYCKRRSLLDALQNFPYLIGTVANTFPTWASHSTDMAIW